MLRPASVICDLVEGQQRASANVPTNVGRDQRIAPVYDLLDLPFERRRYRALRPLLFDGMAGQLLDAGIGTGRNCEFYPQAAVVSGIDTSPAMLARAQERCPPWRRAGGSTRWM